MSKKKKEGVNNALIDVSVSRRNWLRGLLYGGGALAFRSLATGIPLSMLVNPLGASAQNVLGNGSSLIMSAHRMGDALNANCPGSYIHSDVVHPSNPAMAPINVMLDKAYQAATPWGQLSQATLNHTSFFHHRTYTQGHNSFLEVMRLQGATSNKEMILSSFAADLQAKLQCLQAEPVCLGGDSLSYKGSFQPVLRPTSVKDAIGGADGALGRLVGLRQQSMDAIHALYKEHGNVEQKKMLDRFATTKTQVQNISQEFLSLLDGLDGDDPDNQIKAAMILTAMKVAPVYSVLVPMSGDNHTDPGFGNEIAQHQSGIATFENFWQLKEQYQGNGSINHDVTFVWTGVFGRTLDTDKDGRDHEANHCVTMLIGDNVQGSVIGDTKTEGIDSATGAANAGGDIASGESLASAGKTIGAALRISNERIDEEVSSGKVVKAAIRNS